jgi:RNA polymerase sigma-B factor
VPDGDPPRDRSRDNVPSTPLRARSEEALLRLYAAERSPAVREELVRRFMPLARSLAMRYRRQTESLDDLVQVAGLGLVKAVDRFDPTHERAFAAFAVPTILGELRRHFRDHVWNVRLPRGLQEATMKVDDATSRLTEELGRFPTPTEIARRLGISVEDVLEALEAGHARRTLSLDAPRRADDEEATSGLEAIGGPDPGFDRVEAELASGAADLSEEEWQVLRMRFVDELTQQEIGRRLGVSQMQISRISRRALWKLLAAVRGEPDAGPVPASSARAPEGVAAGLEACDPGRPKTEDRRGKESR